VSRSGVDYTGTKYGRKDMSAKALKMFSNVCFAGGFISIIASIGVWFLFKGQDAAYAERFGIFVGLWAPTFFALSVRLDQYASHRS
jgi:uncharacterized membrane protein